MSKGNVKFVRHTYQVSKELKTSSVYQLVEVNGKSQLTESLKIHSKKLLTDLIKIEPFLNMPKATNFNKYLRIKNNPNWSKSDLIASLKKTSRNGLFFGSCSKVQSIKNYRKTLLLIYFVPNSEIVIIDVFKDFYPDSEHLLQIIIKRFKTS